MKRKHNTKRDGRPFNLVERKKVWSKGRIVEGQDPAKVRADVCGALMYWHKYGDTSSRFGWEIDHRKPVIKGGGDELDNLQPLQWENNRLKSDNYPEWKCKLAA